MEYDLNRGVFLHADYPLKPFIVIPSLDFLIHYTGIISKLADFLIGFFSVAIRLRKNHEKDRRKRRQSVGFF